MAAPAPCAQVGQDSQRSSPWAGLGHLSDPGEAACQLRGTLEILLMISCWMRTKDKSALSSNFRFTTPDIHPREAAESLSSEWQSVRREDTPSSSSLQTSAETGPLICVVMKPPSCPQGHSEVLKYSTEQIVTQLPSSSHPPTAGTPLGPQARAQKYFILQGSCPPQAHHWLLGTYPGRAGLKDRHPTVRSEHSPAIAHYHLPVQR